MTRLSGPLEAEEGFNRVVELTVSATVGGEVIQCRQRVLAEVWNDPDARKAVEENMRFKLVMEILRKWTPVIKVRG